MLSLRSTISPTRIRNARSGFAQIQNEILAETGATLGHHGRTVESALADLAAAGEDASPVLLQAAAEEVWAYFVQREMCGMYDHSMIIAEMHIPQIVLNRMGTIRH